MSKEIQAYNNFLENIAKNVIQNMKYALNESTYYCALNHISDVSAEEWITSTSGFKLAPIPQK